MDELLLRFIDPRAVMTWMSFSLGVAMLWVLVDGWRRQSVLFLGPPGGRVDRGEDPGFYWFVMVIHIACCLSALLLFGWGIGFIPAPGP